MSASDEFFDHSRKRFESAHVQCRVGRGLGVKDYGRPRDTGGSFLK